VAGAPPPLVWVTTGAVLPPPLPAPAAEPLVWVTTGAVCVGEVRALLPDSEWEPLVWVTTGADSEPDAGAGAEAVEPLAEVVSGAEEEVEEPPAAGPA
jgi:hypothetical protein